MARGIWRCWVRVGYELSLEETIIEVPTWNYTKCKSIGWVSFRLETKLNSFLRKIHPCTYLYPYLYLHLCVCTCMYMYVCTHTGTSERKQIGSEKSKEVGLLTEKSPGKFERINQKHNSPIWQFDQRLSHSLPTSLN